MRPGNLPETVSSVLGKTFSDLELVIVDDGSTDDMNHADFCVTLMSRAIS